MISPSLRACESTWVLNRDPNSTAQLRSSLQRAALHVPRPGAWGRIGEAPPVLALPIFCSQVPYLPRLPGPSGQERPKVLHGISSNCKLTCSLTPLTHPTHHSIRPRNLGTRLHGFTAQTTARTSPASRLPPTREAVPRPFDGATIPLKPVKIMRRRPGQYQHRTVPHRIATSSTASHAELRMTAPQACQDHFHSHVLSQLPLTH